MATPMETSPQRPRKFMRLPRIRQPSAARRNLFKEDRVDVPYVALKVLFGELLAVPNYIVERFIEATGGYLNFNIHKKT